MLPKSAIGEVVQGEGELGIRLDLTREEDEWLKQLAERQRALGIHADHGLVEHQDPWAMDQGCRERQADHRQAGRCSRSHKN